MLRVAQEIIAYHHERWDETGYVAEVHGDAIPLSGRITAVADTFDAMTHDRPYHRAGTVDPALGEITRRAGHQFDPALIAAFMALDHTAVL